MQVVEKLTTMFIAMNKLKELATGGEETREMAILVMVLLPRRHYNYISHFRFCFASGFK